MRRTDVSKCHSSSFFHSIILIVAIRAVFPVSPSQAGSPVKPFIGGTTENPPYSIRAFISLDESVRVEFFVDGTYFAADNGNPYSLFGDANGVPNQASLREGENVVAAYVYPQFGNTLLASANI